MFAIMNETGSPFETDAIGPNATEITKAEYKAAVDKIEADNQKVITAMKKAGLKRKAEKAGAIIAAVQAGDDAALAELL